jgi:hypothetical protein
MRRVAARTQPAPPPAEDEQVSHAPSAVAAPPQALGLTGTSRTGPPSPPTSGSGSHAPADRFETNTPGYGSMRAH